MTRRYPRAPESKDKDPGSWRTAETVYLASNCRWIQSLHGELCQPGLSKWIPMTTWAILCGTGEDGGLEFSRNATCQGELCQAQQIKILKGTFQVLQQKQDVALQLSSLYQLLLLP